MGHDRAKTKNTFCEESDTKGYYYYQERSLMKDLMIYLLNKKIMKTVLPPKVISYLWYQAMPIKAGTFKGHYSRPLYDRTFRIG